MKSCIIFSCVLAAAMAAAYTDKFDNVDVMEILQNPVLFQNYYNCLMELGPCTADAKELRRLLPDAITTDCAKCTEIQKSKANQVIKYAYDNDRAKFDAVATKYDANGQWRKAHGYA